MSVSVLIPFASEDPWRVDARAYVGGWYDALGYEVIEGTCPDPWRKAVAVAHAVRCSTADVFVVADADCICGVAPAIAAVETGAAWAVPHLMVHRLDQAATEAVYAGADPAGTTGRTQRPYKGFAGGGIVVLRRDVWEEVPLDPRFAGWGGEDSSWAMALTTLAGPPARFEADLFHLWHEPPPRMTRRWGSPASRGLEIRYIRAARAGRTSRPTMAAIVSEARVALEGVTV
jgi:hypothetical protein